jgi:hypothetical protein
VTGGLKVIGGVKEPVGNQLAKVMGTALVPGSRRSTNPAGVRFERPGDLMKQNRFWLELITITAISSLALAITLAGVAVSATLASAADPAQPQAPAAGQTFSGVVTCSLCGAKHNTSMNQSAAGCTKVCLKKGADFALVDAEKVYKLEGGTDYLDKFAGERVTISGTLNGDTIQVTSVDASRDKHPSKL